VYSKKKKGLPKWKPFFPTFNSVHSKLALAIVVDADQKKMRYPENLHTKCSMPNKRVFVLFSAIID
jgi:hypothetical protein